MSRNGVELKRRLFSSFYASWNLIRQTRTRLKKVNCVVGFKGFVNVQIFVSQTSSFKVILIKYLKNGITSQQNTNQHSDCGRGSWLTLKWQAIKSFEMDEAKSDAVPKQLKNHLCIPTTSTPSEKLFSYKQKKLLQH